MKENEEFLRIKSLRYNVHIFHYKRQIIFKKNTDLHLYIELQSIIISLMFTYLRLTCLELASNTGNRHSIQYGNGK